MNGDDSRPQGVCSDLPMFSNATPVLTKHGGWPRPPQGRHPGHFVGRGSTEDFLHKISYAETWIGENTQAERRSLAQLQLQVALELTVSVGQLCDCAAPQSAESWEPPVPAESSHSQP